MAIGDHPDQPTSDGQPAGQVLDRHEVELQLVLLYSAAIELGLLGLQTIDVAHLAVAVLDLTGNSRRHTQDLVGHAMTMQVGRTLVIVALRFAGEPVVGSLEDQVELQLGQGLQFEAGPAA